MLEKRILIYTKMNCPFCDRAKAYLRMQKLEFEEIKVDMDDDLRIEAMKKSGGRKTVPQIFVDDKSIGGYDDMMALVRENRFDEMFKGSSK